MVTRVTRSEMSSFKVKIKSSLWLFVDYKLVTRCLLLTIKHFQALVENKCIVSRIMMLIEHEGSS